MKKTLVSLLAIVMLFTLIPMMTAAAADDVLPSGITMDWGVNVIYVDNPAGTDAYYPNMAAAVAATEDGAVLYCKPDANIPMATHLDLTHSITIEGNDAIAVGAGERDFSIETYQALTANPLTLRINRLNNVGVWGRGVTETTATNKTVNVYMSNCYTDNRIYLNAIASSGATTNIYINNVVFNYVAGNNLSYSPVYSNANGVISVDNCTFNGTPVAVNINYKTTGAGVQVNVTNSVFNDCGDGTRCDGVTYAAPVRLVNSGSDAADVALTVTGCTFHYVSTTSSNGDVLIGEGRQGKTSYSVSAIISDNITPVDLQVQQPGDRTLTTSTAFTVSLAAAETFSASIDASGKVVTGNPSEVTASADPTYMIVIPASVDFGTINHSMGTQTEAFTVSITNALIEEGATITVQNVTAAEEMFMRNNDGSGSKTLAFDLTHDTIVFTQDQLEDYAESFASSVTCQPSQLVAAGSYRGFLTFSITYAAA